MKLVRFVRSAAPYVASDVAGFDDAVAERIVNSGAAVYLVVEEEAKVPPTVADLEEKKIIDPAPSRKPGRPVAKGS